MSYKPMVIGIALAVFGFLAIAPARADYLLDQSGFLIKVDPSVLGDEDERNTEEIKREEAKNTLETARETQKQNEERTREMTKTQQETVREAAKQKLERQIEANKQKTKQKSEFELESEGNKLKIKQKVQMSNGTKRETEMELEGDETLHVDQADGKRMEINAVKDGALEIRKAELKLKTELPISITANNELMITRPDGTTKIVTVLPDQAVANMVARGVLKAESEVENTDNLELTENTAGEPVYQINHTEQKRILGLFRARFKRQTEVKAETGETETQSGETSAIRRFLERLSF